MRLPHIHVPICQPVAAATARVRTRAGRCWRRCAHRLGISAAVAVVLVGMLAVTLLHQQADRRRQAEAIVAHIGATTHELVMAHEHSQEQPARAPALLAAADAFDARLVALLAQLDQVDGSSGRAAQVRVAVHSYRGASLELYRLLTTGDPTAAARWQDAVVTPAHAKLMALLNQAGSAYNDEAELANGLSDAGTLAILALAGLLAGALFWQALAAERHFLRRSEERFRSLVQNSADLLAILAEDGQVRYISPSIKNLTGHAPEQVVGRSLLDLVHPSDAHLVERLLSEAGAGGPGAGAGLQAFRVRRSDGTWMHLEAICTDQRAVSSVHGLVLNARDVSERTALQEQLTHRAFHDALTELPNRALLVDRLGHALARAARGRASTAVVFIDLDNFKAINDSLGHQLGDQLLVGVAQRLKGCIRASDTPARLGGDEFIVLLEDVAEAREAEVVATRFLDQLRAPFVLGGREVYIGASVGIALAHQRGMLAEDLLRHADLATFAAKANGATRVAVYDPSMDSQPLQRLELEADLRRALQRDELRVHYQPIVSLDTGRITGLEALVRWEHPSRGLVSPAEFIPLAEQTGLIVPIGRWVLAEACRQNQVWADQLPDRHLVVSVNLSARQFQDPGLVDTVAAALRDSGLAPQRLKLEITESVAMEAGIATIHTLEALKHLGVHLAIDDFGTGYSSLAYLKRFPVDTLKIDRAFINGLGDDAQDTAIVRSVIALAQALSLSVVAEGVETGQQLEALRALHCDEGQGYRFARPQSAEAVSRLLAAERISLAPAATAPPRAA